MLVVKGALEIIFLDFFFCNTNCLFFFIVTFSSQQEIHSGKIKVTQGFFRMGRFR